MATTSRTEADRRRRTHGLPSLRGAGQGRITQPSKYFHWKGIMHHNYIFRFCPVCGGDLKSSKIKVNEPSRLVCPGCDFIFYLDPKLVACSIVEIKDKIVLLKRAIEPEKGKWVVPGGYVDRGEEVEAATLRETKEECGIDIRIKNLLASLLPV